MATYEEYLKKNITEVERLTSEISGIDERLDYSNMLLMLIKDSIDKPVKAIEQPEGYGDLPPYSRVEISLDPAREGTDNPFEVEIPGNFIAAYTNGTLTGIKFTADNPTNDLLEFAHFNHMYLPFSFKKLFITNTLQEGKTLTLFIGRGGTVSTHGSASIASASSTAATAVSDKDTHFTEAIVQYAKEDENLPILSNKIRITGISVQSDQQLQYRLLFWGRDTFNDTDLDIDTFVGEAKCDLATYGFQIGGAGQYYLDVRGLEIDYEDLDETEELHVSLYNYNATAKFAGATGEVQATIYYETRG